MHPYFEELEKEKKILPDHIYAAITPVLEAAFEDVDANVKYLINDCLTSVFDPRDLVRDAISARIMRFVGFGYWIARNENKKPAVDDLLKTIGIVERKVEPKDIEYIIPILRASCTTSNYMDVVKMVRQITGWGLNTAKIWVDSNIVKTEVERW